MRSISKSILSLGIIFLIASCSPTTTITGSWKNKSHDSTKVYKSVFIAALTPNMPARAAIEDAFYEHAVQSGLKATRSYEVFKPGANSNTPTEKTEIMEKIKATGSDAIFTVTIKDVKDQTRYVPGSATYYGAPSYGYYNSFYGYYSNYHYTETATEGYYTSDKVYFLECNIYDALTEELIWSAQSQTTNPAKLTSAAKEYASRVVYQLRKDKVFKNSSNN